MLILSEVHWNWSFFVHTPALDHALPEANLTLLLNYFLDSDNRSWNISRLGTIFGIQNLSGEIFDDFFSLGTAAF
jgi:hypothetical protein